MTYSIIYFLLLLHILFVASLRLFVTVPKLVVRDGANASKRAIEAASKLALRDGAIATARAIVTWSMNRNS